mgnify:CR=1 FL=1
MQETPVPVFGPLPKKPFPQLSVEEIQAAFGVVRYPLLK